MVETFTAIIIGLAVGASAGALSAFLGWIKDNTVFEAKKFISGVVTGVIAGIVAVLAITATITSAENDTALLIVYATLFVGIIGVDNARTAISGAITSKTQAEPTA